MGNSASKEKEEKAEVSKVKLPKNERILVEQVRELYLQNKQIKQQLRLLNVKFGRVNNFLRLMCTRSRKYLRQTGKKKRRKKKIKRSKKIKKEQKPVKATKQIISYKELRNKRYKRSSPNPKEFYVRNMQRFRTSLLKFQSKENLLAKSNQVNSQEHIASCDKASSNRFSGDLDREMHASENSYQVLRWKMKRKKRLQSSPVFLETPCVNF